MYEMTLEVVSQEKIAHSSYRMTLSCEQDEFFADFSPGQFIQFKIPNAEQLLLRRPFAVESIDINNNNFDIAYFVCGQGTKDMSNIIAGSKVKALGPLGNGFDVKKYGEIWLLAGSIGFAPLYSVIEQNPDAKFRAFVGFPNKSEVCNLSNFEEKGCNIEVFTDDGSYSIAGYALDGMMNALESERPEAILCCGPSALFVALKKRMSEINFEIPCYISMESRMACGTGICMGCNCKTKKKEDSDWEYKRVCVDGPVFDIEEVLFDDAK